jgi:small subunit ribosomal protein S6
MPLYESVFIARQDISQTQVEALLERFGGIVTEGGGEVGKTEYWGVRGLAYRIKKNRKGHYVMMSLDAPAPAIQEMERNMRLDEDILRYLTLKVDAFEEGPSIMMQRGRDDRGRGGRRDRDEHRDTPPGGKTAEARTAAPVTPAAAPEEGAATASKSEGIDE